MRYFLIRDHDGELGYLELNSKVNVKKLADHTSITIVKEMTKAEFEKESK